MNGTTADVTIADVNTADVDTMEVSSMELSFGEKVRNLREDRDMNQTQLGASLHMTQRKLSYIECGKSEPSVEDIIAFCHYFKVSADYLLGIPEDYRRK